MESFRPDVVLLDMNFYTAIEAVGLVISIAFVILIGNYVWQQYSIAHENPIGDRVYAVGNE